MEPPDLAVASIALPTWATGSRPSRGKRVQPLPGTHRGLPRLVPADGVVEVWMTGQLANEAMDPPEDDLAAAQVAHPPRTARVLWISLSPMPENLPASGRYQAS